MSHERFYDDEFGCLEHTFRCDEPGCDDEITQIGDFGDAWDTAKRNGWSCRKEDQEWVHYCPEHRR